MPRQLAQWRLKTKRYNDFAVIRQLKINLPSLRNLLAKPTLENINETIHILHKAQTHVPHDLTLQLISCHINFLAFITLALTHNEIALEILEIIIPKLAGPPSLPPQLLDKSLLFQSPLELLSILSFLCFRSQENSDLLVSYEFDQVIADFVGDADYQTSYPLKLKALQLFASFSYTAIPQLTYPDFPIELALELLSEETELALAALLRIGRHHTETLSESLEHIDPILNLLPVYPSRVLKILRLLDLPPHAIQSLIIAIIEAEPIKVKELAAKCLQSAIQGVSPALKQQFSYQIIELLRVESIIPGKLANLLMKIVRSCAKRLEYNALEVVIQRAKYDDSTLVTGIEIVTQAIKSNSQISQVELLLWLDQLQNREEINEELEEAIKGLSEALGIEWVVVENENQQEEESEDDETEEEDEDQEEDGGDQEEGSLIYI